MQPPSPGNSSFMTMKVRGVETHICQPGRHSSHVDASLTDHGVQFETDLDSVVAFRAATSRSDRCIDIIAVTTATRTALVVVVVRDNVRTTDRTRTEEHLDVI